MRQNNLRKLLAALVDDCGYDGVRKCLDDVHAERSTSREIQTRTADAKRERRPRSCAVSAVESMPIADAEKKQALIRLAKKYDEQAFMPNMGHVRAFLEGEGEDASRIRSRQQGMPVVFRQLSSWSAGRLRDMDDRGLFGPPKTLSAISRSIENFGRREA